MKCVQCGNADEAKWSVEKREVELDEGVAIVNATVRHCGECGEEYRSFDSLESAYQTIAVELANTRNRRLTRKELRWLRKYLGFSGKDFANYVGVRRETVSQWENDGNEMPLATERLLQQLVLADESFHDYEPVEPSSSDGALPVKLHQNSVGAWVRE